MLAHDNLEVSWQAVPLTQPEVSSYLAASKPLFELEKVGPSTMAHMDYTPVRYPISNDESAACLDHSRARAMMPEYRDATNRTAVLVGESSLMAALPYLLEDTIILVDKSPEMCDFLRLYIESLRHGESPAEWTDLMGLTNTRYVSGQDRVFSRLADQIQEWEETGYPHPMVDQAAYTRAHELAKTKAIVPWCGDIADIFDMHKLGDELKSVNANVTMMNLTNVYCGDGTYRNARDYARILQKLPVTPNAPILTTSCTTKPSHDGFGHHSGYIVEATGPFFGLDNLAKYGGVTHGNERGSAVERQYITPRESRYPQIPTSLVQSLVSALFDSSNLAGSLRPIGTILGDTVVIDLKSLSDVSTGQSTTSLFFR